MFIQIPKSLYTLESIQATLSKMNLARSPVSESNSHIHYSVNIPKDKAQEFLRNVMVFEAGQLTASRERYIVDTLYQSCLKEMV